MKPRAFPGLSQILQDLPPDRVTAPEPVRVPVREKRIHTRFDKAFLVSVGSEMFGEAAAVGRNVSDGGMLVEMGYAPPLGSIVTVCFRHVRDDGRAEELSARAEVKHHHYLNYAGRESERARAVGLRFLEFFDTGADAPVEPGSLH